MSGTNPTNQKSTPFGFSFVEVLAAIAIIGIITFLAIPNLIRIKQDGENNLAIARAEALNMGIAAYVQANGRSAGWSTNTAYTRIAPYLAFAPTNFSSYMPGGYSVTFPASISNSLTKVGLTDPYGAAVSGYGN